VFIVDSFDYIFTVF